MKCLGLAPMLTGLLRCVLPNQCVLCSAFDEGMLCDDCGGSLAFKLRPGPLLPYLDGVWVVLPYEGGLRTCLTRIKFDGLSPIATRLGIFFNNYLKQPPFLGVDLWTPVPLHEKRRKKRGFDPVETLFSPFIQAFGLPYEPILERVKATPPLFDFNPNERAQLLETAFQVRPGLSVEGATIVLLDDILTTGTTLKTLAKCLKQAGAASVYGLCLSQG
ncbi:hypothetical protein DID77_00220 [Candidatus Marinamargulisbacteria bacterium SCGC AG-439-L15]|nr:hypothetical protein DID77_00220 [Candidatus Marinamargulisbacteria bacterium SCGC AG-439-L15]